MERTFLDEAVALSFEGMRAGCGGPFGAVVVCASQVVGRGFNRVVADNDPTAHAEIVAIRDACARLGRFNLSDCELYASCEPCPMCFAAAYWARIATVYYANTSEDAATIGFDDEAIHRSVADTHVCRELRLVRVEDPRALEAFAEWQAKPDKTTY